MENNKKRKPSFYLRLVGIVSVLSMGVVGLKNQGDILKYEQANKQANERILDQQEEFRRQLGEIRYNMNIDAKEVDIDNACEEYKALRSFGYNPTRAVGQMTQQYEEKVIDNGKIK